MRFGVIVTAAIAALGISSAQGISTAQAGAVHNAWEKYRANHALKHLSKDAQKGMSDVLNARMHLVQGDNDAAVPLLIKAQRRFNHAKLDTGSFLSAEDQLQVSLAHPVSRGHIPVKGTVQWVPVGGEFVETETIAPERRAAIKKANRDIRASDSDQLNEDLEVVGDSSDFVMALAPVKQTIANLGHAQVLAEARHSGGAIRYIDRALDGIVYVDDALAADGENDVGAPTPTAAAPSTSEDDDAAQHVSQQALPAATAATDSEPAIPSHVTEQPALPHHKHCPAAGTAKYKAMEQQVTEHSCCARMKQAEQAIEGANTPAPAAGYPQGPVNGQ